LGFSGSPYPIACTQALPLAANGEGEMVGSDTFSRQSSGLLQRCNCGDDLPGESLQRLDRGNIGKVEDHVAETERSSLLAFLDNVLDWHIAWTNGVERRLFDLVIGPTQCLTMLLQNVELAA